MSTRGGVPPIEHSITVLAPVDDAFAAFTAGMDAWWPRRFTWSGDGLQRVGMEARPGGFCYEIGPHGMRLDWGRVSVWDPPRRLTFSWQIGPDRVPVPSPAQASEVEVDFAPAANGATRVRVRHGGWERHGDGGAQYRAQMADSGAWPLMLDAYADVVASRHEAPWSRLST
jgi:uncharacterized protein YndB with AHSA1/START domain